MALGGQYRTVSGRSLAAALGARLTGKLLPALGKAAYREMQGVIQDSVPLVPVDTGSLRASNYVAEPEIKGNTVHVEAGYGGVATKINPKTLEPTTVYALQVHENLEAHHPTGQAKFLSTPFEEHYGGMTQRIAADTQREMRGANATETPGREDGE